MVDEVVVERYTSYGRGGAGNLRRPSEVQVVEKAIATGSAEEPTGRRRSSVWSLSSSPDSRRGSILKNFTHAFRRNSSTDDNDPESKE